MYPIDAYFDETFASQMAKLEAYNKHYYRPNSYLHKWWARRCGSTFRLILKGLVTDTAVQDYYAPGGLEGRVILDPMMGGGTTLHEAIRLGANVLGADLDPIPVLQARATLTEVPLAELEEAFAQFYGTMQAELSPFFLTTNPETGERTPLRFVIYGARRWIDGRTVIVVDSLTLRIGNDGSVARLCPECQAVVHGTESHHCQPAADILPLLEKGNAWGRGRRSPVSDDLDIPYWQRYVPLVVVGQNGGGGDLFFKTPDAADRETLAAADRRRAALSFARSDFAVELGRKSRQLAAHGVNYYLDLFSSRQLLYLAQAIRLLSDFAPAVRLNLALLVSTSLEFNSMLCGYKGKNQRRPGAVRHTFSHHAYSFPHTAVENNPLHPDKASGTLQRLFHTRLVNGRVWAQAPRERRVEVARSEDRPQLKDFVVIQGEQDAGTEVAEFDHIQPGDERKFWLRQGSSAHLALPDGCVDFVVTDPPYFDSIQYSDLAAFFRVWLRWLLPDAADWAYDAQLSAVDPHRLDRESRYTEILSQIFGECARVLRTDGRLIFTFHHWNPKAWAALTIALQRANFRLVNRYVVYSESHLNVHVAGMKALLHDVVLVLAIGEGEYGRDWPPVSPITTPDSEQFCRECGALLGYLLAANLPETEVQVAWQQAIR
ncbi:MAG: hypothetical protein KJ069_15590 [Anaerolineae bacterium]|nr:hypothetical protein [Anaerolineae bacterium]